MVHKRTYNMVYHNKGKAYNSTIEAVKGVVEEGKQRQSAISKALASKIKSDDRIEKMRRLGLMPQKEEEQPEEEETQYQEEIIKQFEDTVSIDWNEDQKKRFKRKKTDDGNYITNVMKNYKKRNMLKCIVSGELLPKKDFDVNLDYPARGFRDTTARKNK